jgi:solute carrier family 6 amino acid transporter-like protein 5/7/9/14
MVVTTLDMFTSVLAGVTVFSILGNIMHIMGEDDINNVVREGPGLAFVTYADAIAKFGAVPQVSDILCIRVG